MTPDFSPSSPDAATLGIKQAAASRDAAALLYLTRRTVETFADELTGYLVGIEALAELRCFGAARDILAIGAQRFPENPEFRIAEANLLAGEGRSPEALAAWDLLLRQHPDAYWAWIGKAEVCRKMQDFSAADDILRAAWEKFPEDAGVAWHWAFNTHYTDAWDDAAERWRVYRRLWPGDCAGLAGSITAARSKGDYEEAQFLIDLHVVEFGGQRLFRAEVARLAAAREDWPACERCWQELAREFPEDEEVLAELAEARMKTALQSVQDPAAAAAPSYATKDAELAGRFESLGTDCEFGLVQRALGLEPLGLLRWSSTSVPQLTRAFRNRFAGLGDRENIELVVINQELYLRDLAYEFSMHTFIAHDAEQEEALTEKMAQRLLFLKRKLLEQLTDGEKIFVLKDNPRSEDFAILKLFDEMRGLAECQLVVVQRASAGELPFTFRQWRDGLYVARIDRFGNEGIGWDVPVQSWLTLCRLLHDRISGLAGGRSVQAA